MPFLDLDVSIQPRLQRCSRDVRHRTRHGDFRHPISPRILVQIAGIAYSGSTDRPGLNDACKL
jgi:hypothetical protein